MYRIEIDRAKCKGHGHCVKVNPDLWEMGPDGKARLRGTVSTGIDISSEELENAKRSALVCPEYAIELKEGGKSILGIKPKKDDDVPVIQAHYDTHKEWQMDTKGFFTIKPFPQEGIIRVRYYNEKHQLTLIIEGTHAEEIYNTIAREGLISRMDHAAYVGCELMKAEVAMKLNITYEQDSPLNFSAKRSLS